MLFAQQNMQDESWAKLMSA